MTVSNAKNGTVKNLSWACLAIVGVCSATLSAFADATDSVTNLIGRLDPLTANVMSNFVMLTDIPRPTYHEKKVSDALLAWAKERGFSPCQDEKNNVWFDVPATPGMETKPKVILQGHMDMVAAGFDDPENECVTLDCDETGKIFSRDHKTSIGADDGLGVAMALAVADGKVPHGPVRVLVTTDEEQTETGAMAVPEQLFYSIPYLINIDSETDGELTISSAASDTISVTGSVVTASAAKTSAYCVTVENFRGGHSGQDIDKGRLNAILELGRVLTNAVAEGVDFELSEMTGGNAKNAIPPHAQAIVTIDESAKTTLEGLVSAAQTDFQNRGEANATVSLVATNGITTVLDKATRDNVLTYLTTVHDGVWNMSSALPGLVETSMNHGLVDVTKDGVLISGAARGSVENTVQAEETSISNTAKTCGFDFAVIRSCAPWPADITNPLIGIFSNGWKKVTGNEMTVVATHAGLECGWFSQKAPPLNIVSVGPTLENPHTVNETTYASSVSNNIQLLAEVLANLPERYCVVDLSDGTSAVSYPVSYLTGVPSGGWSDEYKTTKLVLRQIEPGTFMMGSPVDELGRKPQYEGLHRVTLTKGYCIGVFEVTQRQWELVMGERPSYFTNDTCYAMRPVEEITYDAIRGTTAGTNWPSSKSVDVTSFLGRIRAKTGIAFDLPTEAQWEYACRAGTATSLNSGTNLTSVTEDPNLEKLGRYYHNCETDHPRFADTTAGTASVGSYAPNAWGLYDMHGNVWERCLDWWTTHLGTKAVTDPVGEPSGSFRSIRGGCWGNDAYWCRSADRGSADIPGKGSNDVGFRIACPANAEFQRHVAHWTEFVALKNGETFSNPEVYEGCGAAVEAQREGRLDATDAFFVGNEVTADGGAAYLYTGGQVKLFGSNVLFHDNTAKTLGGAICNFGEVYLNAADTIFSNNQAKNGGAIHNEFAIIMTGRVDLETPSDTWVNYGTKELFAEITWDLSDVAVPDDSVCIRNYRYFTNANDCVRMKLEVSSKQPFGTYTLATNIGDDLAGKDKFHLSHLGSSVLTPITTNGQKVVYANRTFALSTQGQDLVMTVGIEPVYVVTNAALDVAGMTWQLRDSDTGKPLTEVDEEGRFIVQSNSVITVVYTAEKGKYFKDGTETFLTGFKATGAEVFDAAEMIAARKPSPGDVSEPKVQLGVVAQRYPWNGIIDIQYRTPYANHFATVTFYANGEMIGKAKGTCNQSAAVSFDLNAIEAFRNKQLMSVKITATIVR